MPEYVETIIKIVADHSGMEEDEISLNTYFEDDLNISPLEIVEIINDIEEEFEIEGLLDKKDDMETVGDLVDFVSDKID